MRKLFITATCLALPIVASAAIKPGQWIITSKVNLPQVPVMPQLPPEQIEQMRQMGITLPAAGTNGPITVKGCVSPADAAGDYPPLDERVTQNCKVQNVQHNGPRTTLKVACDSEDITGTGDVEIIAVSPERYTSKFHVVGTAASGLLPIDMTSTAEGRWVSPTCQ